MKYEFIVTSSNRTHTFFIRVIHILSRAAANTKHYHVVIKNNRDTPIGK